VFFQDKIFCNQLTEIIKNLIKIILSLFFLRARIGADHDFAPYEGCSPDNAVCEGFFGRLKTEMCYGREWSGVTLENFMVHVDTYIRWYNERRIKMSLGTVSPETYRQQRGITR
ncbi:TPA: IS3 family transposase, partial [Salmonella enterica subsp. enterica serovar Saintpaul]